jgi:hypothetical protein
VGGTADQYLKKVSSTDYDTAWATFPVVREVLAANRTYYVRTDGSNSNNGLSNTSGGAFLTVQKAIDVITGTLDMFGFDVTIQVADGTYTGSTVMANAQVGAGQISIIGNLTTPANVLFSVTGGNVFQANYGDIIIRGVEMRTTTSGTCLIASGRSTVRFDTIRFGAAVNGHVFADGGTCIARGNYSITGGTSQHWWARNGGTINADFRTITLTGTPAFSTTFALTQGGYILAGVMTFTGSATGARYNAQLCGVINTVGGGASYFPGNASGTTATGGQYA